MALFCLPFHLSLGIDFSRLTNQFIGMKYWLRNNLGELVRIGYMSQLVKSAMLNSMTSKNLAFTVGTAGRHCWNYPKC